MRYLRAIAALVVCSIVFIAADSRGATVTLKPIADTSLFQDDPNNNLGGEPTIPVGGAYQIGAAATMTNRGVLKFDVASRVPAGSQVTAVSLAVRVVQVPSPGEGSRTNSVFELRRMIRDWGEGTKRSPNTAKNGQAATAGEATWNARFYPGTLWGAPGGAGGTDYELVTSSSVFVSGQGTYTFPSTADLVADVQGWLEKTNLNFGWLMRSQSEHLHYTNRRFASREDTTNAPVLTVEYVPPGGDLRFNSVTLSGGRINFNFTAQAGQSYVVEYTTALGSGSWQVLTNFPVPLTTTTFSGSDATTGDYRFYRLRSP